MLLVEVEWGGRQYMARVNDYGIAVITGGPLPEPEKPAGLTVAELPQGRAGAGNG